ncbi:unnamed protein product, partial [Cladocopium goreaui]
MFNVGCLPCCFGVRGGACVQADVPRAQLSSGTILGEYVGGSEHFSAVPFAAPPVGIRRWKKPEPVEPWPGELDCSSRRPPDDRRGRPVQSVDPEHDRQPTEDCLHLDIWLPMGTLGSLSRSPKGLPVLVWIYGGGLLSGSKDDPGSSGQCYAEQGIIFICINYRVGALGFLCPRHGDPNCGLWDQACALQWIQNEIGNLGGDPKKVTIMGQSAGGDSACLVSDSLAYDRSATVKVPPRDACWLIARYTRPVAMCCGAREDDDDDSANPGPDINRKCTDLFCLPVLVIFILWPLSVIACLKDVDGAYALSHGHDHYGRFCGLNHLEEKQYVFYPDLQNDFKQDPSLLNRYGVCVEKCPEQFETVEDYQDVKGGSASNIKGGQPMRHPEDPTWLSDLPTFPLAGRCIPYDPPPTFSAGAEFCADPPCLMTEDRKTSLPTNPREVCGLQKDGTSRFWLVSKADDILLDGWRREHVTEQVIKAAEDLDRGKEPCKIKVLRDTRVRTESVDASLIYSLLTKYTGYVFTGSAQVYNNKGIVLGLGVGGSMLLSFVIIMGFAFCVQCILNVLMTCLFLVLICADYVLFLQAGLVTGRKGRMILNFFEKASQMDVPKEFNSLLEKQVNSQEWESIYKWCAIGLAIGIVLLLCAAIAMRKNFRILVALLKEASNTMREMPSLLLTPFILSCSMVGVSIVLLWVALTISTARAADVPNALEAQ